MKYFIYLFVILLAFSSCSTNGFLKQRYTNYNHFSSNKDTRTGLARTQKFHPAVVASAKNESVPVMVSPESVPSNETAAKNNSEKNVMEKPIVSGGGKPADYNLPVTLQKSANGFFNFGKQTAKVKDHFQKLKENKQHHGPISFLLRVVISIILLVILVFLIILLVVVLA